MFKSLFSTLATSRRLADILLLLLPAAGAYALDDTYLKLDIPALSQKALHNDARAQTALGWSYYFGFNTEPDLNTAQKWFYKAALQGDSEAQLQLGVGYLSGSMGKEDPAASKEWFEKALASGNAHAGMFLAAMYAQGLGVAKDASKSQQYFDQAEAILEKKADKGDIAAMQALSQDYLTANGVKQNLSKYDAYSKQMDRILESQPNSPSVQNYTTYLNALDNPENRLDHNQMLTALQNSARRGVTDAYAILGQVYAGDLEVEKDSRRALDWLLRAAVNGDGSASYVAAVIYDDGIDITPSQQRALLFYRLARTQLEKSAFTVDIPAYWYYLGLIYKFGLGTEARPELADSYLTKACIADGSSECASTSESFMSKAIWNNHWLQLQDRLARGDISDAAAESTMLSLHNGFWGKRMPEAAFQKALKLAKNDNQRAEILLAYYYRWGVTVDRDTAQALKLYEKLAEQNNEEGFLQIGEMYRLGDGVPVNLEKAQESYKKCLEIIKQKSTSEKDDHYPYATLAYLYLNGLGVTKDTEKALQLYKSGAKREDKPSIIGLARIYESGTGVQKDYAIAKRLLEKANIRDDIFAWESGESATELAVMYIEGLGVGKDYNKARTLLQDAATVKQPEALYRLGNLYENGFGVERNLTKARDLYDQSCKRSNTKACTALTKIPHDSQQDDAWSSKI